MKHSELHHIAWMLLNDSGWTQAYRRAVTKPYTTSTFGTRRTYIRNRVRALTAHEINTEQAETLRRYIDEQLGMGKCAGVNQFASMICPDLSQYDAGKPVEPSPSPQPTQEPEMSKPLTIEKKTFLNNVDIETMSDAQIFELIATEEERIKQLEKIETKPKRLLAEIARRRDGLRELIEHLDATA